MQNHVHVSSLLYLQELLHYLFIMRCFPARLKNGYLDEFDAQRAFLADLYGI